LCNNSLGIYILIPELLHTAELYVLLWFCVHALPVVEGFCILSCWCPADPRYSAEWEKTVTRLGRWIDFRNDYKTLDPSFMESVWWVGGCTTIGDSPIFQEAPVSEAWHRGHSPVGEREPAADNVRLGQ
jgi:hypothetical protein